MQWNVPSCSKLEKCLDLVPKPWNAKTPRNQSSAFWWSYLYIIYIKAVQNNYMPWLHSCHKINCMWSLMRSLWLFSQLAHSSLIKKINDDGPLDTTIQGIPKAAWTFSAVARVAPPAKRWPCLMETPGHSLKKCVDINPCTLEHSRVSQTMK